MAENTTLLEVRVNNAEALKAVVEYTKEVERLTAAEKELKAEMKDGGTEEQRQQLAELQAQRTAYNGVLRQTKKEISDNVKEQLAQEGSLNQLRSRLSQLTKEYDNLSKEMRESEFGAELQADINGVTDELKAAEEATQRYYRNVGNYRNDMVAAFQATAGSAGAIVNPVKNATLAFKTLSATPVIAILGLLANIIMKVIEHFKSSEENVNQAAEAMAAFKVIGDVVTIGLQTLAKGLGWVATKIAGLLRSLRLLKDRQEENLQIELNTIEINKRSREAEVENAKAALEVAKLRNEAKDKENKSIAERLAAIQKAGDIELRIAQRNQELAELRLSTLRLQAKQTENDKEMNDELAKAEAEVFKAQMEYYNKTRELLEQENTLRAEYAAEQKARAEAARARLEREIEEKRAAIDMELELMEEGEEKKIALENERYRRQKEELQEELKDAELTAEARAALNRQIELAEELHQRTLQGIRQEADAEREAKRLADLAAAKALDDEAMAQERLRWQNRIAEMKLNGESTLQLQLEMKQAELEALHRYEEETEEEFNARMLAKRQEVKDAERTIADEEVAIQKKKYQSLRGVNTSLIGLLNALGEENEGAAVAAKILGFAEIAINTAVAISEGVKSASGVKFPGNLVAIASIVTAIMTNMTSAISLLRSAKVGGGEGGGTGTPIITTAGSTGAVLQAASSVGTDVPYLAQQAGSQAMSEEATAQAVERGMESVKIYASWTEGREVGNNVEFVEDLGSV